jgi:hypothetical protein
MSSGHPLEVIREVLGSEGLCQCGCRLPTSQCPTALRRALQSVLTWHVGATNTKDEVLTRVFEHTARGVRELEAYPWPAKDPQDQIALGAALENFREIYKTVKRFVSPEMIQLERQTALEDKELEIVITQTIICLLRGKLN